MTQSVEDFIEHVGVKGMRWGVRKKSGTGRQSTDYKKTVPLRNRKSQELTNRQIKTVNERLSLEQNYGRLNPTTAQKGKVAAASILATVGMAATAYNLATSPAGKAAIAAGKKMLTKT